ncbi:MAG: C2H2-type zinc finger protein [Candidatus Heimdallarchaeaceae archaeon]
MISEKGASQTEPRFDLNKEELLKSIVDAVESFRDFEHKVDWQPVAIDTSTIARYIAYGQFESFLGASQHPSWVNLYNRINYFLKKFVERKGGKWYFPRDFSKKVDEYLLENIDSLDFPPDLVDPKKLTCKRSNVMNNQEKETSFKSDFVVINFEDYIQEKKIFVCKICKETFDTKNSIIQHIKNHSLESFLPSK